MNRAREGKLSTKSDAYLISKNIFRHFDHHSFDYIGQVS